LQFVYSGHYYGESIFNDQTKKTFTVKSRYNSKQNN